MAVTKGFLKKRFKLKMCKKKNAMLCMLNKEGQKYSSFRKRS
jgi:hypothetical protein